MSKNKYQRGEVHLVAEHAAQGSEQKKTRPWILVGASPINAARGTVLAIPLSTQALVKPPLSIEVLFNNLHVSAVVDQLRTLDKRRFIQLEGQLAPHEMSLIDDALRQVLAL